MDFLKRTWAEIDLDALEFNFSSVKGHLRPGCKTMCVVKADAYGHGAVPVARTLAQCGADWLGVSNLEEGAQLRAHGIETPIFVLGYTPPQYAEKLCDLSLTQAVLSEEYALELSACAQDSGVTLDVHIKVDTGMNRMGLIYQSHDRRAETLDSLERICRLPGLSATGLFTHFAVSDEGAEGEAFTRAQFACFCEVRDALCGRGLRFALCHCCNSGGILAYPDMHLDLVRPGIMLYGLYPSEKLRLVLPLQPVMTLKSVVALLKESAPGGTVSYGCTYRVEKPMRIATVPIGYADGYPRAFSGKADMLLHGRRVKIVGRVCMDQLMLDVTEVPGVSTGEEVVVFGEGLPVDELARLHGTINYEMVCMVGKRVARIYKRGGVPVEVFSSVCPD